LPALPAGAVALTFVGVAALAAAQLAERSPAGEHPEAVLGSLSSQSYTSVTTVKPEHQVEPRSSANHRHQHGGQQGGRHGGQHGGQQGGRHQHGGQQGGRHQHGDRHRGQSPTSGPRTSCRGDAHIGESTSLGLVSPSYLPDPRTRLPAQLERVGVRTVRTDILGARSIVEKWHDQPNAQEAVEAIRDRGYSGCWTVAMGTNDAANQAVGGVYSYAQRIDLLMHRIGGQPVLWLTVKSLRSTGPYADANMRRFDDALRAACARYPDLRIYDWRSEVRDSWFISDGIHFTSAGYAERARRIADALARAFPAHGGPSASCVVGSGLP
jgi:hypothetical protein